MNHSTAKQDVRKPPARTASAIGRDRVARRILPILVATAAGSLLVPAHAQPSPTLPMPPSVAQAGDDRPVAQPPTLRRWSGVVKQYVVNEFGDVEGLVSTDGTQVRFPAHMGPDLAAALKPGDPFVAEGEGFANGSFRAYTIGKPGSQPLTEARPSAAGAPLPSRAVRNGVLASIDVDGVVQMLLHAPRGEVDGVVLTDGTIVKVPPVGRAYGGVPLQVGAHLTARGLGTSNRYGRCIRADVIGLDGEAPTPLQPKGPQTPGAPRPAGAAGEPRK